MRERLQHYIDGTWVNSEGGARREVINPATEEACAVISIGTSARSIITGGWWRRRSFGAGPIVQN